MKTKKEFNKALTARGNLIRCLRTAKKYLASGDPVEAVSALDMALRQPMQDDDRRTITKAKDEAESGSPDRAEHLLCGFVPKPGGKAPPKEKPFEFRPEKHHSKDGVPGHFTNGERAASAALMLNNVPDWDAMEYSELLTDGLANLLHWCDREKVDFDAALKTARMHHEMER